jgi:hypothetical protein
MVSPATRSPLGFVVEGLTEFSCYPALVHDVLGGATVHVPVSNARGNHKLRADLEALLEQLVTAYHPMRIMVSLDAREVLREQAFATCAELRLELQARCDQWLRRSGERQKLQPLPDKVVVVIQHPSFENWLLADVAALRASIDILDTSVAPPVCANVDEEVPNAGSWFAQCVLPSVKFKPAGARALVARLDSAVTETKSPSFAKFAREVRSAYEAWLHAISTADSLA